GRPAAAPGHRARHSQGLADPDPGRGDLLARHRVGAAGAGSAREPDEGPDVVRDRAPAVDRPPRRRHPGDGSRPDRRGRSSRRAAGEARQSLLAALPDAAARRAPRAGPADGAGSARRGRAAGEEGGSGMIKSMTGFASLTHDTDSATVGVTVRSVNHRFLDLQLRLPSGLADREPRIRALVQQTIARGRVEIAVNVQSRVAPVPQVELNEPYIAALEAALEHARTRGLVTGHLTPGDLVRLPHAIVVREAPPADEAVEALGAQVDRAVEEALTELERMRVHEGEQLRQDLEARRRGLEELIEQ